jgi:DNA polymerase (family 10)
MRAAAVALGLSYLGISEHSQSADYARGLTPDRLRAQRDEIAAMNAEGSPCTLLTGVESDILADGSLDYDGAVLALLEVVIASSHRRFSLDRARSTERMVRAASHPRTDVLGHPTGRLLLARPPLDFDVDAVLDACAKNRCAVELNGSAHRLDFGARELAMAKERGIPVSIAADAHAVGELGEHLGYAISVARRAGLTPDDVLNARPLPALRAWLEARRASA